MAPHVIAQYNIVWLVAGLQEPRLRDFTQNIARINRLAEESPGFVWRLQTDTGDSVGVRVRDDARILVNLSAWDDLDALHRYSFKSEHAAFFRRRREWFTHEDSPFAVVWWIPRDHRPTAEEGEARLAYLKQHGPTQYAFTFKRRFSAPTLSPDEVAQLEQ